MNNKYAKIFALVGFIVGGIWAAQNNPHFIGIYDVTSLAGFIGGAIPLCLIASLLGYAIDKFAHKASQLNDQSTKSESLDIETKQNWVSDNLYKQALNELEGGDMQAGLWAKCFADADGLENVAKAQYIKIRASQLQLSVDQATSKQLNLPLKSSSSPVMPSPNPIKYIIGAAFALTLLTVFGTLYSTGYYQDNREKEQVKALEKLKERERQATTISKEPPVRYEKNYFQILFSNEILIFMF
jgi:hypothetical protein